MKIEVCGSGCSKCAELEKRAKEAVAIAGLDATVEHVYDMTKIIERGIFMTYLLSDPVLSLPSILVVSKIMGAKRTAVYVALIIVFTVSSGYLFGLMQGK